jgi:hypothetical protein
VSKAMLATSVAFIALLEYLVNVLVMGPDSYRFCDYARVGLLLTLIAFEVILLFLPNSGRLDKRDLRQKLDAGLFYVPRFLKLIIGCRD